MSPQKLQELKKLIESYYQGEDHTFEVPPQYIFEGPERKVLMMVPELPDDTETKLALAAKVGELAVQQGLTDWVFICEGYFLAEKYQAELKPGERFSEHPARVETITVTIGDLRGPQALISAEIIRKAGHAPRLQWNPDDVIADKHATVKCVFDPFAFTRPNASQKLQ